MPAPTHAISRKWIHAFYRAHHRALAAYAASLTRSRDDAEDLVHEALAGMLEVRGAIENPEAYAYRAIRNRAIDRARRAVRVEAARSVDIGCAPSAQARDWTELCRALETLSPAAAEVVVLHARSGLSFPADCGRAGGARGHGVGALFARADGAAGSAREGGTAWMTHRWIASCARRRCQAWARGTRRGFMRGSTRNLMRARAGVVGDGVPRLRWRCWRAACTRRSRGRCAASLRSVA